MTTLMIIDLKVKDPNKLKEYSDQTPEILKKFQGELVVKGKSHHVYGETGNLFDTTVVFEFPSKEFALDWYNSAEYQALLSVRDEAFDSSFKIVG